MHILDNTSPDCNKIKRFTLAWQQSICYSVTHYLNTHANWQKVNSIITLGTKQHAWNKKSVRNYMCEVSKQLTFCLWETISDNSFHFFNTAIQYVNIREGLNAGSLLVPLITFHNFIIMKCVWDDAISVFCVR